MGWVKGIWALGVDRTERAEQEIGGCQGCEIGVVCRLMAPTKSLLASFCLSFPLFAADGLVYVAGVDPGSASLAIIADGETLLTFDYYDWGAGWSGVKRRTRTIEEKGRAAFEMDNVLVKGEAPFRIEGAWSQAGADTIRFDAVLKAGATAPLVMAMFGMDAGRMLRAAGVEVQGADGSAERKALPLPIGSLGTQVQKLVLHDAAGRRVTVAFDQPATIPTDGAARFAFVTERMEEGKTYPLRFEIKLPGPVRFYPGPSSVPPSTAGWYAFQGKSPIPETSEWAMRSWLEAPAGKHGRIRADGDRLVYNGKPIKLWGTNVCYESCAPNRDLADRRADFYAALGINTVRLHKYADGTGWAGILAQDSHVEYDKAKLDRMDYFVAALKKRGIYTKLSPVFIMKLGPAERAAVPFMDELGEMSGNRVNPKHGSIYLAPEIQDLLIEQVTKLLKHENPYTGMTYAADPAIAYVEIYNEDSALFGGVTACMSRSATLRKRAGEWFADWLRRKYGDESSFLAAWGQGALNCGMLQNQKLPQDESWAERRIYPAGNPWFFDPDNLNTSQKGVRRRLLDTMAFLYEIQNAFYAKAAKAYRDAGYGGEITASNWIAGRAMSHLYNLHSDALIGAVDRHNYFGEGKKFAFHNRSMLESPGGGILSASLNQVDGRPFMLSEWIHVERNEWGVEGPAIIGAYGMGLQGWDVSYAFQNSDEGTWSRGIFRDAWDVTAPNLAGIFPAVSRQVLRGDVKASGAVHYRNVHVPSLDEQNMGFNDKVAQSWDVKSFDTDVFPAAALAAARGVVRFTDGFEPTEKFDLAAHTNAGKVMSATGELAWKPGERMRDGYFTVNTAGTQAVVGFGEGVTAELADASIAPKSRYGAIYLTARSRDGVIAKDKGVLVSAIARARNHDAVIAEDCLMFSKGSGEWGKPNGPVVMESVVADITLKRGGNPTVHVLDHDGVRTGKTVPVEGGKFRLDTGRDATPYYLVAWD